MAKQGPERRELQNKAFFSKRTFVDSSLEEKKTIGRALSRVESKTVDAYKRAKRRMTSTDRG